MSVDRWYPSKIDWWLGAILVLAPLASISGLAIAISSGRGVGTAVAGVATFAAIYIGLVFPTRYGIDHRHLIVRHGLVRRRIPLLAITEVAPTRNLLSSPALSLDRLRITFGGAVSRSVMISPADRAGFLATLAASAKLRRDGERLVRP